MENEAYLSSPWGVTRDTLQGWVPGQAVHCSVHSLPAMWTWASSRDFLDFSFLICTMGIIVWILELVNIGDLMNGVTHVGA